MAAHADESQVLALLEQLEQCKLIFREKNQWVSLPAVANCADYELDWITKGFYFD